MLFICSMTASRSPRRKQRAIADEEKIAAQTFGDVSRYVQQNCPRPRIARLDLQIAEDKVDVVAHLGLWAHGFGRRSAHGRHNDFDPIVKIRSAGGKR